MPNTKTVVPLTDPADLEALRQSLETKRRELLSLYAHDVRMGQEANDESADDSVDRANNSFSRELMFSLSDSERQMLILVEEALERIERDEYGHCTHCGRPIGLARLNAVPWARYCIDCQESEERGILER